MRGAHRDALACSLLLNSTGRGPIWSSRRITMGLTRGRFCYGGPGFVRCWIAFWRDFRLRAPDQLGTSTTTDEENEQTVLFRLLLDHPVLRSHAVHVRPRAINAFAHGDPVAGWAQGDLVVHLAGCWADNVPGENR